MLLTILTYLTFSLFSFGQLGRISFFDQQINIYLYETLVLSVLLVLFVRYGLQPIKDSLKKFILVYLFLLFLFVSILFGVRNFKPFENLVGLLYFLRLLLYFGYFFYLLHHIKRQPQFGKILTKGLLIFIVLTAISSILQYFFYPDLRNLLYAGWDPHLYRLFGTFFDTSIAGAVYGVLLVFLNFRAKEVIKNKYTRYLFLAIFFIFIILTYNRSLYAVFLTVSALFFLKKHLYYHFLRLLVLFVLLVILAPKPFGEGVNLARTFSIESRIDDYRTAIKIWQKKPLLGYGYNRIRYLKRQMNIIEEVGFNITHSGASFHSSFLVVLVSAGVLGFSFFILTLIQLAMFSEFNKYIVLFLGLLSFADNIFLHPFILFLFFSLTLLSRLTPSHKLR
ncbi:O-antigen ligase family protein [Candidatus Roizmanbacteria bacterium]|nr:O-antigen ligase family protein [Candidatus Roizmanbacteria bacterium]